MSARLLIADADPVQRHHLEATVNRMGYTAETVETGRAARERLLGGSRAAAPRIDLLILDIGAPDTDATALLAELAQERRELPTIVQAAPGAIETIRPSIRAGAADFIVKPVGAERLEVSVANALHVAALADEVRRLARQATGCSSFAELVGASEAMERVTRLGQKAARTTTTILLEGEAGSGKEAVARAIHGASDRRGRAFVNVDCRGLPPDRALPILFGDATGRLADATGRLGVGPQNRSGKIFEAEGGTLFLDEVGSLPIDAQAALLRALQSGEVAPVGARRPVEVDVRVIVASSRNLIELVGQGLFREDLFYRLHLLPIAIPSLRSRREDIGTLARQFSARFAAELGKSVRGVGAEALALLESYDWPGNVRQLENAVYRATILAEAAELTVAEFPQIAAEVGGFCVHIPPAPAPAGPEHGTQFVTVEVRDPNVLALLDEAGRMYRLDRLEAEAIRFALDYHGGHISAVARGLGIGRSTLYRKMREYGIGPGAESSLDALGPNGGARVGGAAA
jgi:DNA-binding NtrC family response regulator